MTINSCECRQTYRNKSHIFHYKSNTKSYCNRSWNSIELMAHGSILSQVLTHDPREHPDLLIHLTRDPLTHCQLWNYSSVLRTDNGDVQCRGLHTSAVIACVRRYNIRNIYVRFARHDVWPGRNRNVDLVWRKTQRRTVHGPAVGRRASRGLIRAPASYRRRRPQYNVAVLRTRGDAGRHQCHGRTFYKRERTPKCSQTRTLSEDKTQWEDRSVYSMS